MKDNFSRALARVLVYEGGLVNNPDDPGGLTDKGITQRTYNAWLTQQGQRARTVAGISATEVAAIYKNMYWDRVKGDELPPGVDFCVFDAAVNSGVGSAAMWAQAVMSLPSDGDFGPKTLQAVQGDDAEDFIRDFCARRLGTLKRLRTWSKFGKGWSARVSNVQKIAIAWAQSGDGPETAMVDTIGGHTKVNINDVQTSKVSQITTHIVTGGAAAGTAASNLGTQLAPAVDVFTWLKYLLAGLTCLGALAGVIVMVAKNANDAAATGALKATVDPTADQDVPTVKIPAPITAGV